MPAIITITFSPCIDKSTSVASLLPEKKLQCSAPLLEPGGGGINVARAIKKLGGEATAVFPSGGYTGKYFNQLIKQENIPCIIIETCNETRENIIVLDESNNAQYRFGMPGTTLNEKEWGSCLDAVDNIQNAEFIVASGSLPPGVPVDIYARLSRIAKKKNAKFIIDASGEPLILAVEEGAYLIKPNLTELCSLSGQKELHLNGIKRVARDIIRKGRCEVIVVSMGSAGGMLVTGDFIQMIMPPPVTAKSTVGAGDSMLAGIIFYLSNERTLSEAVQYGVACGTAAVLNPGTGLCHKGDADKLYPMIQINSEE